MFDDDGSAEWPSGLRCQFSYVMSEVGGGFNTPY